MASTSSSQGSGTSSRLGTLPLSWLSQCLAYMDLRALLSAGSVSQHWRSAQQARAAWVCEELEEGCSRVWTPRTLEEIANPPRIFYRCLHAMRIDVSLLAPLQHDEPTDAGAGGFAEAQADAEEDDAVELPPPVLLPSPFIAPLLASFPALRCVSVYDVDAQLSAEDVEALCRVAVDRLTHFSIERDDFQPPTLLSGLLQPAHGQRTQLQHLRLLTSVVDPAAVRLPLASMDSQTTSASSQAPSASLYAWPLIASLTELTVSIAAPRLLRMLAQLVNLSALDLAVLYPLSDDAQLLQEREEAWSSLHSTADSSARPIANAWVSSLHALHLSCSTVTSACIEAVSHLTSLTDLAMADMDQMAEIEPSPYLENVRLDASSDDTVQACFDPLVVKHNKVPSLHPSAILQLKNLVHLTKLELNFQNRWLLPLVPFLAAASPSVAPVLPRATSLDAAHPSSEASNSSPLAFWASFPALFQLKLYLREQDLPCLNSLEQLVSRAIIRAARVACTAPSEVQPHDLLLYSLGASTSIRSLHINPLQCGPQAMQAFARGNVMRHLADAIGQHHQQRRVTSLEQEALQRRVLDSCSLCLRACSLWMRADSTPTVLHEALDLASAVSAHPVLPLFDFCAFWFPRRGDADGLAAALHPFGPSLRYLHFVCFPSLHDAGLLSVLHSCTLLHTLDLRRCASLTRASLAQIGSCIPGLHSLNLSNIPAASDDVLDSITQRTPALHSLHLEYTNTTSSGLLPLLAARLHLLCLNVKRNADAWTEENLREYKDSRGYEMQLLSDYEETGEK